MTLCLISEISCPENVRIVTTHVYLGNLPGFQYGGSEDFDIARREILLRRTGHEILLQSGDSTSRVLPVKKIAENEYQISFENELTFQADSLVNTTQRLLAKDPLADDYVVTVLNSDKSGVAYGYAISKNKKMIL